MIMPNLWFLLLISLTALFINKDNLEYVRVLALVAFIFYFKDKEWNFRLWLFMYLLFISSFVYSAYNIYQTKLFGILNFGLTMNILHILMVEK